MKELVKSKCMVGFLVILIGFLYINAGTVQKMNESRVEVNPYHSINR